ncbi:MAG: hypothetical protein RL685_5657 [Pseudomonadota bacterium]|jgi:hypothetical protein
MRKLAASLILCACSGGSDTGNPIDNDNDTGGPGLVEEGNDRCDLNTRALALDEATGLGFSAAQLLQWVSGEHRESLLWQDQSASFEPEHGRSEIALTVEPLGARFIDRSPKTYDYGSGAGGPAIALADIAYEDDPCGDSIALDVRIGITTASGALAETVDTTLVARASDAVSGSISLPIDQLAGSFEAEVDVPQGFVQRGTPKLMLSFTLSRYGDTGALSLSAEFVSLDGNVAGQGGVGKLAQFPADNYCEQGGVSAASDQTVRGVSMAAVLEQLASSSPARIDGSTATLALDFQSSAQRLCVTLDGPESGTTRIEFPGSVSLLSSDQRIDGELDVTLAGEAAAGVLTRSSATVTRGSNDPTEAAQLLADSPIVQSLDLSSYDGAVLDFTVDVSETEALGWLRASGLDEADCVRNPPPVVPGAMSTPGCRGTDRIELWNATWRAQP